MTERDTIGEVEAVSSILAIKINEGHLNFQFFELFITDSFNFWLGLWRSKLRGSFSKLTHGRQGALSARKIKTNFQNTCSFASTTPLGTPWGSNVQDFWQHMALFERFLASSCSRTAWLHPSPRKSYSTWKSQTVDPHGVLGGVVLAKLQVF